MEKEESTSNIDLQSTTTTIEKMKNTRYIYLLLYSLLIGSQLIGQQTYLQQPYQFQHLTEEDGLANNLVHGGLLDSSGFMWFATHTGLSRWDGIEFRNFLPDNNDSLSISGTLITNLLEDKEGFIWIVSHHGNLCRFDPKTEVFKNYPYPKLDNNSTIEAVMKIYQGSQGMLWIGAFDEGFLRFDPKQETFKRYNLNEQVSSIESKFTQNSVIDIIEDIADTNVLWLAANNGLYRFEKNTEKLQHFPSTHPGTKGTGIQSLAMFDANAIWLGTYGAGLVRFDKKNHSWNYFLPNQSAWKALNFAKNIITGVTYKSETELWLTSKDNGVGIFHIPTQKFSFFQPESAQQNSIIGTAGYKLYKDRTNRIWFFMEEKGIHYLDPAFQNFIFYPFQNRQKNEATPFAIKDFILLPATKNLLAIGKGIDGLYQLNMEGRIQQVLPLEGFEGKYQVYNDLLKMQNGTVWVAGGHSRGGAKEKVVLRPSLLKLDPQQSVLKPYTSPDVEKYDIQKKNILGLIEPEPGHLWGITGSAELFHLHIATGKVEVFKPEVSTKSQGGFQCIVKQADRSLFYIGTNRGLLSFDYEKSTFSNYPNTNEFNIRSIQEKNGKLWMGTYVLKCLNLATQELESIDHYSNTPIVPIDKVFLDAKDRLWCTTQNGLFHLNTTHNNFIHFGADNGLYKEFFFYNGVYSLPDGTILLGKEDGFFKYDPDAVLQTLQSTRLSFTSVKVNDKNHLIDASQTLSLSHTENSLYLSFSPMAFSNQAKNQLTYQLEGVDEDWVIPADNRNFAIYNKLPPGDYLFKAKIRFQKEAKELQLPVTIAPPFYQTTWAYLCYFLITVGLLYWLNQFLVKKRLVEHEANRLKELNQFKTRLYTNITHEFRTPLTVISGMADQIKQKETRVLIKKNSHNLLNLVNQMLDLSKLEAGQLTPSFVKGDIIVYLKYLVASYQSYASTQNRQLAFHTDHSEIIMDYEPNFLNRILSNLLANALKFTNQNGNIIVSVLQKEAIEEHLPATLSIQIKDDGIGIDQAELSKIFDRFYQADNSTTRLGEGTGIGLTLVKELVGLLDGQINVESEMQKGTQFTIQLPIQQKAILQARPIDSPLEGPPILLHEKQKEINPNKDLPLLLIIEDNEDVVHYLKSILQEQYQLVIAQNGKIGIEKAQELIPDIIISDIMMPIMDGFEVCDFLKKEEKTSHIPIIVLTAKASHGDKLLGLQNGADAYLTKPFDRKELLIRLKHIIEKKQKIQAFYAQHQSLPETVPVEHQFIQKIYRIIEAHYQEDTFALPQLCEALHLSRTQVFRKVKALTNQSPSDMILHFRLQEAKKLLGQADRTITEITYQVGFKNQTHFSTAYKKYFGHSPSSDK